MIDAEIVYVRVTARINGVQIGRSYRFRIVDTSNRGFEGGIVGGDIVGGDTFSVR